MHKQSARRLAGVAAMVVAVTPLYGSARAELQPPPSAAPAEAPELASVPLARMPLAVHRRAARYLEARRSTSDSVWFDARLGHQATPLHRPGVEGIAYWEVPVVGPAGEALGYMILSTASHDLPVVGSASGGSPPSVELARTAALAGEVVTRIWMPSLFTFVAENARGAVVAQQGSLPLRLEGVDRSLLDLPESERLVRIESGPDDRVSREIPPAAERVRHGSWSSWSEYLGALSDPAAIDHEIARRNAAPFWQVEDSVTREATRIDPLEVVRVPLLARGSASFSLRGAGARLVSVERVRGSDGEEWLDLRVKSSPTSVSELQVEIGYASGERELLGFAVPARVAALPRAVFAQAFPATCKRVALRTHKGYFVRIVEGGNGQVDAKAQRVGPWETMDLEQLSDGTVAFRSSSSGAYLSADGGGGKKVSARGGAPGTWERFKVVPSTSGTHAFKTGTNRHMVAEGGGNGAVNANRPAVGAWERFQVICNPPVPTTYFADRADERTAWSRQRKYDQLKGNVAPNKSPCASGCGATAWAMLIGYMDNAAAQGVSRYAPYRRAYLAGGGRGKHAGDAVAPELMDAGIRKITIELRDSMNDWGASGCSPTGARFTMPHIMAQATQYFWGRIPARVRAEYDPFYVSTSAGVNKVLHSLRTERRPIAIGMHQHYPVAWGIRRYRAPRWNAAQKQWTDYGNAEWMVDANWGWGEKWSRSVPLWSWFYGVIDTVPYSRVTQIANGCKLRAQGGGPTGRVDRDYKCNPHLKNSERHVGMEAAERLIERDVLAGVRAKNHKVCLLNSTDIQCAPCNTTDRLIVRMDIKPKNAGCPAGTVNELR